MTDRDDALTRARALKRELVARGVRTSIELQTGRPGTPNGGWYDRRFVGSMGHHTVSRRSMGPTPVLALVKRGRPDLPGPLCNGYLGWDGVARIICLGWANHPGAGGPYTLPAGVIPKDNGRPYLFGWEHEGGLDLDDWDAGFRALMGKCHAATLAWLGRDERSHLDHKHWAPLRKVDRLRYSLWAARDEAARQLEPGDDDMRLNDEGPHIARLQRHLDRLLDRDVVDDGVYGPKTADAVGDACERMNMARTPNVADGLFCAKLLLVVNGKWETPATT